MQVRKVPFRDRMTYEPSSWLIFNLFNSTANNHSFNIDLSSSSGWAGKGDEGLSTKGKASKRSYQKMDW